MQKLIDISGEKINMLTVICLDHVAKISGKTRTFWKCKCDCGNIKVLRKDTFYYSYSTVKSCGCWHKKESSQRRKDKKTGRFIKMED